MVIRRFLTPIATAACAASLLAGCGQADVKPAQPASPSQIARMQETLHQTAGGNLLYQSQDFDRELSTVPPEEKPAVVENRQDNIMQRLDSPRLRAAYMIGYGLAQGKINPLINMSTTKGDFTLALLPERVPVSAGNFLILSQQGFYNGLKFWRYVPGYIIQGGDPRGDGTGGPGFTLPDENGPETHVRGAVALAKSGPNTAGSQFYIVLKPHHELDHHYTVFARVVRGMDVVDRLRAGDKIKSVHITGLPPGFDLNKVPGLNPNAPAMPKQVQQMFGGG